LTERTDKLKSIFPGLAGKDMPLALDLLLRIDTWSLQPDQERTLQPLFPVRIVAGGGDAKIESSVDLTVTPS